MASNTMGYSPTNSSLPGQDMARVEQNYNINDRDAILKSDWPSMAFIEKEVNGDSTNWWAPNRACIHAMLRSCGMKVAIAPVDETYIAIKNRGNPGVAEYCLQEQYEAAVGKSGHGFQG